MKLLLIYLPLYTNIALVGATNAATDRWLKKASSKILAVA